MPEYKLDFSNVDRVESDIHVKFNNVITVPVHCDGKDTGIAIYLGITNIAAWARKHNANPYAYDGPLNAEQLMVIAGRLSLAPETYVDPRPDLRPTTGEVLDGTAAHGMPSPYAVRCPIHGKCYMSHDEYSKQMRNANQLWLCPVCDEAAMWDDANYEAAIERGEI